MAEVIGTFDTGHTGPVHDTQLDYYGRRLATASSDHTIRIFDVSTDQPTFLAELKGHEGPVWQVCWAHPTFGSVLVSCSYDKKVLVWKETQRGRWEIVYSCEEFSSSINGVSWCPWDFGLQFACAVADGSIVVCSYSPETRSWSKKQVFGHPNGANSVSWAPATNSVGNSGVNSSNQSVRLVSGGCDNQIRIWKQDPQTKELTQMGQTLDIAHSEWVRDVAWRPSVDLLAETIASCGDDKIVVIWTQDADGQGWHSSQILNFDEPVWRISWSVTGTVLAASSGEDVVTLFKENSEGKWEILTNISNNEQFNTSNIYNSNSETNPIVQSMNNLSPQKQSASSNEITNNQANNHLTGNTQNTGFASPEKIDSFSRIEDNVSENLFRGPYIDQRSSTKYNSSPLQHPNISQSFPSPILPQSTVLQSSMNDSSSPPLPANVITNISSQSPVINQAFSTSSNPLPPPVSSNTNDFENSFGSSIKTQSFPNASLAQHKVPPKISGDMTQNLQTQNPLSQNQILQSSAPNQGLTGNSVSLIPPPVNPGFSGPNSSCSMSSSQVSDNTVPHKFTASPSTLNSSVSALGGVPPPPPPPPPPPGIRRYPGVQ